MLAHPVIQHKPVFVRWMWKTGRGRNDLCPDNGCIETIPETGIAAAAAPCIAADGEGLSLHERVAAAEEGEVIELPAGKFELDRPLLIETPLAIVGQGVEKTIIRSTATGPSVMLRVQDVDDVRLAGFTLDGAGTPCTPGAGGGGG